MAKSENITLPQLWFGGMLLFTFLAVVPVAPAMAVPVLQINGSGILIGATGVDVSGTLHDVTFKDGTCMALFSGCDSVLDFTFQSETAARAASQALLDQVFVGPFAAAPELTFGCPAGVLCNPATPFSLHPSDPSFVQSAGAINYWPPDSAFEGINVFFRPIDLDTTNHDTDNWAVWSTAAPVGVPEASTYLLLITGLLGLAGYRWTSSRQGSTKGEAV